jgi:hypothetical protein
MWYDVDLTFSKGCLGWLNENAKIPELVIQYLHHLFFGHCKAHECLEERDVTDVEVVAQLKAHRFLPLVGLQSIHKHM